MISATKNLQFLLLIIPKKFFAQWREKGNKKAVLWGRGLLESREMNSPEGWPWVAQFPPSSGFPQIWNLSSLTVHSCLTLWPLRAGVKGLPHVGKVRGWALFQLLKSLSAWCKPMVWNRQAGRRSQWDPAWQELPLEPAGSVWALKEGVDGDPSAKRAKLE